VSAREWLYNRLTGALIDGERASAELDAYRAEVLLETAADLKAHCLDHNRFAHKSFMACPCWVADELIRMTKEAS
jgi:hypothetical protein